MPYGLTKPKVVIELEFFIYSAKIQPQKTVDNLTKLKKHISSLSTKIIPETENDRLIDNNQITLEMESELKYNSYVRISFAGDTVSFSN